MRSALSSRKSAALKGFVDFVHWRGGKTVKTFFIHLKDPCLKCLFSLVNMSASRHGYRSKFCT